MAELALEVALHLEQVLAKHLHVEGDRVRPAQAGGEHLVDDRVGLRGCSAIPWMGCT